MVNNFKSMGKVDVVIIALDIPMQERFIPLFKKMGIKTMVITPLESSPLCLSWAFLLGEANKVFFISQLGEDEAKKAGLEAEHLRIGLDTVSWRLRTQKEYTKGRESMNISPDTLVVLTVADNQERKNLAKSFEIVSKVKNEKGIKVKHILVTREHSPIGWKLRDLAMTYNIASELMIFERGLDFKALYSLYAISDVFLLASKAEGLGLPILEAMAVGVPVAATNTGAITEVLSDGRGYLLKTEYSFCDPWGNAIRHIPSAEHGANILEELYNIPNQGTVRDIANYLTIKDARKYVETLTWDIPVNQLEKAMEELDEKE